MKEKQTVSQQYRDMSANQSKAMNIQVENTHIDEVIQNIMKTIQKCQMCIRQIQIGEINHFSKVENQLQSALHQLTMLRKMDTQITSTLPQNVNQQLQQAFHEIGHVNQIMTQAQQSLNKTKV